MKVDDTCSLTAGRPTPPSVGGPRCHLWHAGHACGAGSAALCSLSVLCLRCASTVPIAAFRSHRQAAAPFPPHPIHSSTLQSKRADRYRLEGWPSPSTSIRHYLGRGGTAVAALLIGPGVATRLEGRLPGWRQESAAPAAVAPASSQSFAGQRRRRSARGWPGRRQRAVAAAARASRARHQQLPSIALRQASPLDSRGCRRLDAPREASAGHDKAWPRCRPLGSGRPGWEGRLIQHRPS